MATVISRQRAWQLKQARQHLCPICSAPVARACDHKACGRYCIHTTEESCGQCGHRTVRLRLCSHHLSVDRARSEQRRKMAAR